MLMIRKLAMRNGMDHLALFDFMISREREIYLEISCH